METRNNLKLQRWVEADAAHAARRAAQFFFDVAQQAVRERGRARIALSGGSTPAAAFRLLADPAQPFRDRMPWPQLEIFWVDERCVPPGHPDSNYRMTREALLDHVPIPAPQIHRMEGELDPETAARRYEQELRREFSLEAGQWPRFDLVALGMGDDGHTASLFPGTTALSETERLAVANHVPQKDSWRLTLTWPVINQARQVFFLIAGVSKSKVVQEVFLGPRDPMRLPSQLIHPIGGILTLILDRAAASELPVLRGEGPEILERDR